MPVIFTGPNGPESLIPAPFVSIDKTLIKGPDGRTLRVEYVFNLTGTIVNVETEKDSPASQDYSEMEGVLAEQDRIAKLFSLDGGRLEISSPGGGGPNTIDAYCTVESVRFNEGKWVNRCEYAITLKSNAIEDQNVPTSDLESFDENWSITENEDSTYSVSHQIEARGLLTFNGGVENDPLAAARAWVYSRMYLNNIDGGFGIRSGTPALNLSTLISNVDSVSENYWNKSFVETVDPVTYSVSVSESFIHNPAGDAREEWGASVSYEPDNQNRITININGRVIGFADNAKNWTLRGTNAKNRYSSTTEPNLYTRMTAFLPTGFTANPTPITRQITYENDGTISYSVGYTATKGNLIPNAIDENISIDDVGYTDVFAQIQVPGRTAGPVVQWMNTYTLPERTVSIDATIVPSGSIISNTTSLLAQYLAKPNTNDIVNALKPNAGYFYIKQDSENWNPIKKKYSRVVSWIIQPEGSSVSGLPSSQHNPALF